VRLRLVTAAIGTVEQGRKTNSLMQRWGKLVHFSGLYFSQKMIARQKYLKKKICICIYFPYLVFA
jgi:hypothetical protein